MIINLNKELVTRNFSKAASTYNEFSSVQSDCAELLCDLLFRHIPDLRPATILDIGSGTGVLVKLMLERFHNSSVIANDISELMLDEIRKRFSGSVRLGFLLGDMDKVSLPWCCLAVSNFAMQWSADIYALIKNVLSKSNVFAFTTLVDGTFHQLHNILGIKSFLSYPTKEDIGLYIEELGVQKVVFEEKEVHLLFKNFYCFLQYVRNLGIGYKAGYLGNILQVAKNMQKEFLVSYNVLFAIIRKG